MASTASLAPRTMRDRAFVKHAVLRMLSDGGTYSPTQLVKAVPGSTNQTVNVTLHRMVQSGEAEFVSRGMYRLGIGPKRIAASRSQTSDWIRSQAPGTEFDCSDVCSATGATDQVSTGAIKALIARGFVYRVGRGRYRMVGGDLEVVPDLSLSGTIRRFMGTLDGPCHWRVVNEAIVGKFPHHGPGGRERIRTHFHLNNMAKAGDVERISPGVFRLLRREPPTPTVPSVPKGVAEVAKALGFGGLWLVSDLTAATGLTEIEVNYALLHLEENGSVASPYTYQWRRTDHKTDPVWDSRTLTGAVLGVLLRGGIWRGVEVMREIQSLRYIAGTIHELIGKGLVERVSHGLYRCPEGVRETILSKFAVRAPSSKSRTTTQGTQVTRSLSALEARLVDGMATRGHPMRKFEIAAMAGIGRGSAVRAVNALVGKGLVRETLPGLYRVAA